MIVSMLMKKVINKAGEEHPIRLSGSCINNLQGNLSCSICAGVCKEDVYAGNEPRYDKCINCNLCSAACPAQTILPSAFFRQQICSSIEDGREKVYIYCHKRNGIGDININCLVSLPWEIYAVLAFNKNVVVSLRSCEQCRYKTDVISLFNKIKGIMGKEFFQEHFTLSDEVLGEKIMSRREAFQSMRKGSQKAAGYIISDTSFPASGGLIYRKYFMKKLESSGDKKIECNWKKPVFNKNCWGCGLCTSVCPNKAIVIEKENSSKPHLVYIPWRCTQCGLCIQCCPENGIDGWECSERGRSVKQKVIADVTMTYCPKCWKGMKPLDGGYFCYYCGHKKTY